MFTASTSNQELKPRLKGKEGVMAAGSHRRKKLCKEMETKERNTHVLNYITFQMN